MKKIIKIIRKILPTLYYIVQLNKIALSRIDELTSFYAGFVDNELLFFLKFQIR
jgi:hypothetical protein